MIRIPASALVVALAMPMRVWASPPPAITPESATASRATVEQAGAKSVAAGELHAGADEYWSKGIELRDPILIVLSAETLGDLAARDRSIESAKLGLERLELAYDMLYFLRDGSTSTAWMPITAEQVASAIDRAERCETELETLIAEIEAEIAAAAATPEVEPEPERKRMKPGTGLLIGGGVAIGLGVGMLGVGALGLVMGAGAQEQVEDPLVYQAEHEAAESRGRTGNILAGVGFAIGGVAIGAGAALIVLGLKKRKRGPEAPEAAYVVPAPTWFQGGAGIGLGGRF